MTRAETPLSVDIVERTDSNLATYARDAGKCAHDRGLEQRGAVMKSHHGVLVVERRGGSMQILRKLPATQTVLAGTVFKRRRNKESSEG